MKEQEPILADELSRRITAEMQGQMQPPVSEAIQPEAELAAKLISLSNDTQPDPDFVAALGSQLARRAAQKARQPNKSALPERPSPCGTSPPGSPTARCAPSSTAATRPSSPPPPTTPATRSPSTASTR